jgi:TonB family protein
VSRALVLSMSVHAVGLALVMLAPTGRTPRWQPPSSISVDLVASARAKRVEAPPAPQVEAAEPSVAPATEPKDVVETRAEPPKKKEPKRIVPPRTIRKDAPRRDEGPSLEERIRRRLEDVGSQDEPSEPAPAPAAPSGSPAGSTAEVQAIDFPFAWYLNVLRTRITDSWDPPGESLLAGRSNRVLVAFRVYRDGRVSDIRVEGSRTPGLDASARRAVERAQPFPPLPDAYPDESLEVSVRFTAQGSQ